MVLAFAVLGLTQVCDRKSEAAEVKETDELEPPAPEAHARGATVVVLEDRRRKNNTATALAASARLGQRAQLPAALARKCDEW